MGRVLVLSLGGTIAMQHSDDSAAVPQLDAADLVGLAGSRDDQVEVDSRAFRRVPGIHLTFQDILELAAEITTAAANGYDGVVITQGTDTIEEIAFALDLLLDVGVPVVVTGAMRTASQPGADGPANLLDAISVASSPALARLGTVVVFAGEIHAARFVRKAHTMSLAAFVSISGPLGWIVEGEPMILVEPAYPLVRFEVATIDRMPQVALLGIGLGGLALAPQPLDGFDGIVVEATGAGHVPPDIASSLKAVARDIPVILTSRTRSGPILRRTYGFAGSEKDLLDSWVISGGYLDGPKARIALTLALLSGQERAGISATFDDSFGRRP